MTLAREIKKVPFEKDGLYGNPHQGFVGNIYTYQQRGLGVYHEPIVELASQYIPGRVVDLTGMPVETLYKPIQQGHAVWVITNSQFSSLSPSHFHTWRVKGKKIKITYYEHSVLLTGYSKKYIYLNDPLYSTKNRRVLRKNFEKSWVQMGSQAVTYLP
jgi:uncharacterized protein YvpB